MHEQQRGSAPSPVSGSSILVIFAILCLTAFALLSLSTVQAHLRRMDSLNRAIADYYAADCQAETLLAEARGKCSADGAAVTERWTLPVSDSQELTVEAEIYGPNDYRVKRWQLGSAGEWLPEDELSVWDGELPGTPPETDNEEELP